MKKLKKTKEECAAIKRWLKAVDNNTLALLATKCGLKSSTAVSQWLVRGRVSKYCIEQIKEICK
jgi:hypothetical protein